jgi:hypothetical protein
MTPMIRKLVLALGATAALGAAALSPTSASAFGHGHWHGHHGWYGHGFGFYGPTYIAAAPDCYVVKRVVETAYGPRVRRVTVCD